MTPAEKLRARLAAHVNKIDTPPTTGTSSQSPSASSVVEAPVVPVPETAGTVVSHPAVQSSGVPVAVIADVQSTDLALVERPADERRLVDNDSGLDASSNSTDLDLTNPVHAEFISRLNKLDAALAARDPSMPLHLLEIHKALITYDEITPLLRPEEIGRIMAAQQQHVAVVLRQEVTGKAKSSATRAAAKVTLNDI